MIELLKIIVEKGGLAGIAVVFAYLVLTTFIKNIKADPLSKDAYHEVLLTVLKITRLTIVLMFIGWIVLEFLKAAKSVDWPGSQRVVNLDRSAIVRDSFANVLRQQQLENQAQQQRANEERLRQQQEEIDRRKREVEEQARQEEEAQSSPQPVVSSDGLSNGDYCYIRGSHAGIALRTRPLNSNEVQEINRCKSCDNCWTKWCDRIDDGTYIGPMEYGETVVFYRKEGNWNLVRQVSTGKNGWMSATYAGKSTLQKSN